MKIVEFTRFILVPISLLSMLAIQQHEIINLTKLANDLTGIARMHTEAIAAINKTLALGQKGAQAIAIDWSYEGPRALNYTGVRARLAHRKADVPPNGTPRLPARTFYQDVKEKETKGRITVLLVPTGDAGMTQFAVSVEDAKDNEEVEIQTCYWTTLAKGFGGAEPAPTSETPIVKCVESVEPAVSIGAAAVDMVPVPVSEIEHVRVRLVQVESEDTFYEVKKPQ